MKGRAVGLLPTILMRVEAARLGLIEGVKMAAATVQTARFTNPESLRDSIEAAILDLIKEYEK